MNSAQRSFGYLEHRTKNSLIESLTEHFPKAADQGLSESPTHDVPVRYLSLIFFNESGTITCFRAV